MWDMFEKSGHERELRRFGLAMQIGKEFDPVEATLACASVVLILCKIVYLVVGYSVRLDVGSKGRQICGCRRRNRHSL